MSGMRAAELIQYKLQPALDECALHRLQDDMGTRLLPALLQLTQDHFAQARKMPE
jgi:hypothetical protein